MSKEFKANQNQKLDNQELNDWLDSLDAVVENHGRDGAKLILEKLEIMKIILVGFMYLNFQKRKLQ